LLHFPFLSASISLPLSHDVRADGPCRPVEAHELAQRRGQLADELVVLGEVEATERERNDALGHEGVVGVANELGLARFFLFAKRKEGTRARAGRGPTGYRVCCAFELAAETRGRMRPTTHQGAGRSTQMARTATKHATTHHRVPLVSDDLLGPAHPPQNGLDLLDRLLVLERPAELAVRQVDGVSGRFRCRWRGERGGRVGAEVKQEKAKGGPGKPLRVHWEKNWRTARGSPSSLKVLLRLLQQWY